MNVVSFHGNFSVLASFSYLLKFLVAVDFLCCDKLKAGVEESIKERIDQNNNCIEVLNVTIDYMGLQGLHDTTIAALEPLIM